MLTIENWFGTAEGVSISIIAILGLILTIACLIVVVKKLLGKIVKNTNWSTIFNFVKQAVINVENSDIKGSENKKKAAIGIVDDACKKMGIESEVQEIGECIDECIAFFNMMVKKK